MLPTKQLNMFLACHLESVMEDMHGSLDRVRVAAHVATQCARSIQEKLHDPVFEWAASNRGSEIGNGEIVLMLQQMQSNITGDLQALGRRLDGVDTRLSSMDQRLGILEGVGEPVPAPIGESVDRVKRSAKARMPGSRPCNRRGPLQSQVPAGSSRARGSFGTDQPAGALRVEGLMALVRGPPAVRGAANSPVALSRGAEAHLGQNYSCSLMVSRDEVEHVPPGVPCLWESESDMATDECTFRMPTDRKSPYYVDPGPDPTGTPHPSGWLEKWALNFDHAAVTFSETGDPRVEVFAEEKDLLATNSPYVWVCSQAYLEAAGYLRIHVRTPTARNRAGTI
jgi:hypothetical protein